ALQLLASQGGHRLTAYYLKVWLEDEVAHLGNCPWEEDLRYARAACDQVGVPLRIVSLQAEYLERVVAHALEELRAGRTPSPDIFCNRRIKFGAFLDRVTDCERVATGHYARTARRGQDCLLRRSPDPVKDQTYFLSHLRQDQVRRALFPIGHLRKSEVRALAAEHDLPTRDRKDSQGICFLGKIPYRDFVEFHLGRQCGEIVEESSGRRLGEHQGYWFYTIGQRFGLGLGGGPWYVVRKDVATNRVYVAHAAQRLERARHHFEVGGLNWIAGAPEATDLQVKLRHGPELVGCRVEVAGAGPVDGVLGVHLAEPDPGIAPGQHAVFYDGEVCLGGGIVL
ncbi:MAG: tRNA 2-thiouridine(34) synthase MnmA, partial [Gemmatimonadota bacterium]